MGSCFSKSKPPRDIPAHSAGAGWKSDTTVVLPGCEPIRLLGEGTFGTVVLVRERFSQKLYAAKVMNKSQLVDEEQLDNIVTERQVLREAGPHPFIVECQSGFQTPNAVVLVLEYVSGGDMYDLMRAHGCLTEQQARHYIAEITVAVSELHRHDFVFRDLKLENILVDEKGHVRLTDFGLAGKFRSGQASERAIFDISGTAIYQAPEMLAGQGHGRVVDWWALGVLTYVLIAGRPPFSGDTREELCKKIAEDTLDLDNDERLVDVSPEGKDLIAKLLDKNPATRLGSAGSDAKDVQAHVFFKDLDWEKVEKGELDPPLKPGLECPGETSPQEVKIARSKLHDKVSRKHTGSRKGTLDAGEYKPVNMKGRSSRVSIGLDFDGKNQEAAGKTWAGTANDFGRVISKE